MIIAKMSCNYVMIAQFKLSVLEQKQIEKHSYLSSLVFSSNSSSVVFSPIVAVILCALIIFKLTCVLGLCYARNMLLVSDY